MFEIIDEQKDFLVVNKHPQVNIHCEDDELGLIQALTQQLNSTLLHPVHRLDKVTSGLVVVAKNVEAAQQFQQLFSQHQVSKFYLAISDKKPKKKQGTICGDMAKARRGMWKLLHSQTHPAITQFHSHSLGEGLRAFLCRPISGKTHQIRVALKSMGSPIVGDPLYYPKPDIQEEADRCYLHAYSLSFSLHHQRFSYRLAPTQGKLFQSQAMTQLLNGDWQDPQVLHWPSL